MPDLSPAEIKRDKEWAAANAALFRAANDERLPLEERLKAALEHTQGEVDRMCWRLEAEKDG